jgi:protoheme IX farnesyltransferase
VVFAVALAAIALPVLSLSINLTTGLLGAGAIVSYVAIYTPLKYRGPVALLVGAVPGALPPLMGWIGLTGYWYLAVSLLLGGAYTAATLAPLGEGDDAADRWGRRVFLISLFYIPVAFTALMLDLAGG